MAFLLAVVRAILAAIDETSAGGRPRMKRDCLMAPAAGSANEPLDLSLKLHMSLLNDNQFRLAAVEC